MVEGNSARERHEEALETLAKAESSVKKAQKTLAETAKAYTQEIVQGNESRGSVGKDFSFVVTGGETDALPYDELAQIIHDHIGQPLLYVESNTVRVSDKLNIGGLSMPKHMVRTVLPIHAEERWDTKRAYRFGIIQDDIVFDKAQRSFLIPMREGGYVYGDEGGVPKHADGGMEFEKNGHMENTYPSQLWNYSLIGGKSSLEETLPGHLRAGIPGLYQIDFLTDEALTNEVHGNLHGMPWLHMFGQIDVVVPASFEYHQQQYVQALEKLQVAQKLIDSFDVRTANAEGLEEAQKSYASSLADAQANALHLIPSLEGRDFDINVREYVSELLARDEQKKQVNES